MVFSPATGRLAVSCLLLSLVAACAHQAPPVSPGPSPTEAARAAFGARLEPYQGQPAARMISDLGAPDHETRTSEGGRMLVWERKETKVIDGQSLDLDCKITALTDPQSVVTGVVGGGSTLFCARIFAKKS